jgi:hypothetical protein
MKADTVNESLSKHRCAMKIFLSRSILILAIAAFTAPALAQQYKWVDKNGRIGYGDTPPAGAKVTLLKGPSGPAAPAAKADAKEAPKGPLTPAQQDAAFRKRQQEAEKARELQAKRAEEAQAKQQNCANAQAQLRALESGQRIVRTDAKGERYYIEDAQRASETAQASKAVGDWCG